MTNSTPDIPAENVPQAQEEQPQQPSQPQQQPSPHEKAPPENPPVDDYDLERGKANLDRVIAK